MNQHSLFQVPKSDIQYQGFYGAFYEELLSKEEATKVWESVLTKIVGSFYGFTQEEVVILLDSRTGEILADKMIEHLWIHETLSHKIIDGIIIKNSLTIRENLTRIKEGEFKMSDKLKLTKLKARVDVTITDHVTDNHPNDKIAMTEGIFQALSGCENWSKILDDYTLNKYDFAKRLEEIEQDLLKIIRGSEDE